MRTLIENNQTIIDWLLESDVSIQYQAHRDLLGTDRIDLKSRIPKEGWGAQFLPLRGKNGHWGKAFYQPKWTSSHYTLLDLKNLCIPNNNPVVKETIQTIIREFIKINEKAKIPQAITSDVCLNGMFLNYASYFQTDEEGLRFVVDFILSLQMKDGGFNCNLNRKGAVHSSLHSTLSVIEGIREYAKQGYQYRLDELQKAETESREFILQHRLFKSDKTGGIIDKKMMMLSYPSRWRYDILRALDYFRDANAGFDSRMTDAIEVLISKQRSDKKWSLQAKHVGAVHFDMETVGSPSRWNTLRALRVLKHFGILDKDRF